VPGPFGDRGIGVEQLETREGETTQERGDGDPDHPAADDGDAVAEARPAVPQRVHRRLDRAGEDGAVARDVVGDGGEP